MRKTGSNKATSEKTRALKLADSWFSKYIRLKHSFESSGIRKAKCYTCENVYPILDMDCGHWQKRQNLGTRFHKNNARPQCTSCNDYNKGEFSKFESNLIDEIGVEKVMNIKSISDINYHVSIEDLKDTSKKYRTLFNELLKELKIKSPWK